jgi:hypothetical protein
MPENQADLPKQPSGRPFPWVCPNCRSREVRLATIPYHAEQLFQGKFIAVDIPRLEVPRCGNCGELVFNYNADEQILAAVKAHATELHRGMVDAAIESSKPTGVIS